jgi:hypothetical protein
MVLFGDSEGGQTHLLEVLVAAVGHFASLADHSHPEVLK